MVAIGWIIRILVLLIVIRLVLRAISGRRLVTGRENRRQVRAGGTLERDPHCGTYVPRSRAVTARSGGTTLYFCSDACRDAHLATRAQAG